MQWPLSLFIKQKNTRENLVMGLGGISIWQLVIILAIVIMLFGTKRMRNLGSDLGGAIKGFKGALNDKNTEQKAK